MSDSYDYIIVGAGSAGCVIASRLTEDKDISILVIEAGGRDRHPLLRLPIAWPMAAFHRATNWNYQTEPEPQLGGRQIPLPRGKVLGGSSAINGMGYKRGHPRDYDLWRQMGLEGWSYAEVLPYFKRSENSWRGDDKYHSTQGPLSVRDGGSRDRLLYEPLAEAAVKAGYKIVHDIGGPETEGLFTTELTVDERGRRHSTARAFLYPAMGRPNLTVVSKALTTRVIVENGRAVGVEFVKDGQKRIARAEREVVLSAGAYNSPQILMLSGIGPADEIRAHDIACVHDLPGVGQGLVEHPAAPVVSAARAPITFHRELRYDRAARWYLQWALSGKGPYASNGNTAGLFVRSDPALERPDLQLTFNTVSLYDRPWWPWQGRAQHYAFSCIVCLINPRSRGWLRLRSANPADPPRIWLNLFGEQADLALGVEGIRRVREIYATEPQASLIAGEVLPGPKAESEADLIEHIRRTATTMQHPACSCRMGIDDMAVVDAELKVRGIAGLRVADASIFPSIPGGNINAPTIMVGEKCADMLRGRKLSPEP